MRVLFDRDLPVHYGFFDLTDDGEMREPGGHLAGQVNGLCGTAFWGSAHFVTGLHTGSVPLRIEWHETEPPVDDAWEEVVEAPFESDRTELYLSSFDVGEGPLELGRPGPYRVRYCASGMDESRAADTRMPDDPAHERCLVQLWPAPVSADAVIKQTSGNAEYWHGEAQDTPPPPTPEQVAAEAARRRAEREAAAAEAARQVAEQEAERAGRWAENGIDEDDQGLIMMFRFAGLQPEHLQGISRMAINDRRRLADRWAREVGARVDLGSLDWNGALDAAAAGEPIPAPFDDPQALWMVVFPPSPGDRIEVRATVLEPGTALPAIDPTAGAVATIQAAIHPDPTRALLDTVTMRCRLHDADAFRAELSALLQVPAPVAGAGSHAPAHPVRFMLSPDLDRPRGRDRTPRYRTITTDPEQWETAHHRRHEEKRLQREQQRLAQARQLQEQAPQTAEELARIRADRARRFEEDRLEREHQALHPDAWGGRTPTEEMVQLFHEGARIHTAVRVGFDLFHAALQLPPDRQRRLTDRITREFCSPLDITVVRWEAALDSAMAGRPPVAPLDDWETLHRSLFPIDPMIDNIVPTFDLKGRSIGQLSIALHLVSHAVQPDPRRALVDVVGRATFDTDAQKLAVSVLREELG